MAYATAACRNGSRIDRLAAVHYIGCMDWLWGLYKEYVNRSAGRQQKSPDAALVRTLFLDCVRQSTATVYVMEPIGDTIRFRGLGRWTLPEVPDLLADPNAFIADRFGGGKYKVNFHHG